MPPSRGGQDTSGAAALAPSLTLKELLKKRSLRTTAFRLSSAPHTVKWPKACTRKMNDAVERAASALGSLEAENAKLLDSVTRAVSIEADGRPQYKLAVGDQLEVLESNLGGLLYSEDSNLGTESETDEEVKLEVLTTTSSLPTPEGPRCPVQ